VTRALRDPRWLAGLAVAVVFAVVCVLLAQWQLDRRVERADRNAAVLENFDSSPVPLEQALPGSVAAASQPWPGEREWQPVRLRGSYDAEGTVLVRNRPQGGSNGYLVAVPFRLAEAAQEPSTGPTVATVLLVRGWVPSGAAADSPDAVPAPPPGVVDVVARLRPAEAAAARTAPDGQAYRLHVPELLAGAEDPLSGAYGVVGAEAGAAPVGVVPVPRPDTDPGPHLAYGVQWYMFALAGLVIWVVLARRHAGEHPDDDLDPRTAAAAGWVYDPGR
jgi:cytochrome oxidase assembly protein ShyY1